MVGRHVFARLGRDQSHLSIKHIRARAAAKRLTRARRGHAAQLLGTDRDQYELPLQPLNQLVPPLGASAVPTAWDAQETRADEDRFFERLTEEIALEVSFHHFRLEIRNSDIGSCFRSRSCANSRLLTA
jgi:hypothetical protein